MISDINKTNYIKPTELSQNVKYQNVTSLPGYGVDFESLLKQKLEKSELKFSKHAMQRAEQRGIEVSESLVESLSGAIEKARAKGAKDVVIIGQKDAFIINIPNNVVITAMSGEEMKQNIFTNIDSAVIL